MFQNELCDTEGSCRDEVISFIKRLVGQPFLYGYKFPHWCDLYEFGFGKLVDNEEHDDLSDFPFGKWVDKEFNENGKRAEYVVHAVCPIKVVWRRKKRRVELIDGDTNIESFHSIVSRLSGLKILRISLSSKNDLWIDLGKYWVILVTTENDDESWRFFKAEKRSAHLVASSTLIALDEDDEID